MGCGPTYLELACLKEWLQKCDFQNCYTWNISCSSLRIEARFAEDVISCLGM